MNIICCPVRDFPDARATWPPETNVIPIVAEDIESYWAAIEPWWAKDDLWLLEQDIHLTGTEQASFDACPEPWCMYQFVTNGQLMENGVGCVRWRREFMQHVTLPLIYSQPGSCGQCHGNNPRCWRHVDGRVWDAATSLGYRMHVHGLVGHRVTPAA